MTGLALEDSAARRWSVAARAAAFHAIGALVAYIIWLIEWQSSRPTIFTLADWWLVAAGVSVATSALLFWRSGDSKRARVGAIGSLVIAVIAGVFEYGDFLVYSSFFGASLVLWAALYRSLPLAVAAVFSLATPWVAVHFSHEPTLALQLGALAPLSIIVAAFIESVTALEKTAPPR